MTALFFKLFFFPQKASSRSPAHRGGCMQPPYQAAIGLIPVLNQKCRNFRCAKGASAC
jgi:hypothetical protein